MTNKAIDLSIPWFLDRRESNPRRAECVIFWAKLDRERAEDERRRNQRERYRQANERKRAEQCRIEREKLEAEKAERRAVRQRRKANQLERKNDRLEVLDQIRSLRLGKRPETVGQIEKASGLPRKRIMSALRWLKRNGRITTEGRRYVEC